MFIIAATLGLASGGVHSQTEMTADAIMAKVAEKNRHRSENLKGYMSSRTYHLHYRGFFGKKDAEMLVEARFSASGAKEFRIISESGSKFLIKHVLRNLISSEQEAQNKDNRQETAVSSENYYFTLQREETESGRRYYVLDAQPKRKNKFLFKGHIWIDAEDFALARVNGEPAKNPSIWISKTNIGQRYAKVAQFWLPEQNVSTTNVRLGGVATLTINYENYVLSPQSDSSSEPLVRISLME